MRSLYPHFRYPVILPSLFLLMIISWQTRITQVFLFFDRLSFAQFCPWNEIFNGNVVKYSAE